MNANDRKIALAILAQNERLFALLEADAPAKTTRTTRTKAVTPTTTEVKTGAKKAPEGKAFRSAKGKEAAKAQVSALWAKTLKDAKATKRAQLTDAQFEAYQAGAKAIWAAVPKTRSTKA